MTEDQARRLWDYTTTALGDNRSHMRQLGNGEWVVILHKSCYHLWDFEQWNVYAHDLKKRRNRERRKEALVAIDAREIYRLAI